jgi:hypothetical protein
MSLHFVIGIGRKVSLAGRAHRLYQFCITCIALWDTMTRQSGQRRQLTTLVIITLLACGQGLVLISRPVSLACSASRSGVPNQPPPALPLTTCCCTGEGACQCGSSCCGMDLTSEPASDLFEVIATSRPCLCGFPDGSADVGLAQIPPPESPPSLTPRPTQTLRWESDSASRIPSRPIVPPPRS